MKTTTPQLFNHLGLDSTSLAFLWKVVRPDGLTIGFTTHDLPITFTDDGGVTVTYDPTQGGTATATDSSSDMSTSNQELTGFLDSDAITETDIFAGKYDYAVVEIRIVNWRDLTMGALLWKKATLGIVKFQNGKFEAELRGLEFYLSTNIGETYGPTCRADLGDARCTVDIASFRQAGTVLSVSDLRTFVPASGLLMIGTGTPTDPAPANWFNDGVLTFTSGQNNGYSIEVATWDTKTLVLFENMPFPITAGDTFTIEPGCNKAVTDCFGKFNNIANMRAEPDIPGMDALLIYPNADGSIPA